MYYYYSFIFFVKFRPDKNIKLFIKRKEESCIPNRLLEDKSDIIKNI